MELMSIGKFAKQIGVNDPSQKDDLETQVNNVKSYMIARGYQFEIIEDIGSGINYDKKGLRQLIDKINKTKRLIDEVKSNDIGDKDKTETN